MCDQDLDWMTQGLLALLGMLQNMPKHSEKLLMNYDPEKILKDEDHFDNFYLHLQTLEVCHDDVACIILPCSLDGREVV